MRLLALLLAAVAFVPAAGAGGAGFLTLNQLSNHADPSLLRVNGGVLVAYDIESTGSVDVVDTGGTLHNHFNLCCGYSESLAVDTSGLAQLAFWSNATGKSGYMYEKLDDTAGATTTPVNLAAGTDSQALPGTNRVPLVADGA